MRPLTLLAAALLCVAAVPLPSWTEHQGDQALRRAWLAWSRGEVERAEAEARAAVGHRPEAPEAWEMLCGLLTDQRRWSEADAPCERSRALLPEEPRALLLHGRVSLELGRRDAAADSFARAAAAQPDHPSGPLGQALVAARLDRDWHTMAEHLGELRRRQPGYVLALLPKRPGWEPLADDAEFLAALQAVLLAQNDEAPAP